MKILLDIHSHILPAVDDGAENLEQSIEILKKMQADGITDVIATPHFYADSDILEDYLPRINKSYETLINAVKGMDLPNIMLGCEVLYYRHIGTSESVGEFTLNGSEYLLLELTDNCIGSELFSDITDLREKMGITVIVAHLERYFKSRNFKKLLKFIKDEGLLAHINASSLISSVYAKPALRLIKNGYVSLIATDAHSPDTRPPVLKQGLEIISKKLGAEYTSGLISNSQLFYSKITEDINDQ